MPSGQCEFIYEPSVDGYRLKFEYQGWNKQHKTFLDVMKGLIPSSEREFNWDTKVWFIQATSTTGKDWFKILEPLIDLTFYPVYKFSKEQSNQYQYGQTGGIKIDVNEYVNRFNLIVTDLGLPQLVQSSELNEATRIYRKAALLLHPDRNPNDTEIAEKMSKLNEAWSNIKQEKYKQGVVV